MSASIEGHELLTDSRGVRVVFYQIYHSHGETLKRYTDFSNLHSQLSYTYPAVILPPLPPKHSISRLLSKPWGYTEDNDIINRRIRLLNHYINRLLSNDYIKNCKLIDDFLFSQSNNNSTKPILGKQSILLISPDPAKINLMNPYLSQMPIPSSSFLKSHKSLVVDYFKPIEFKIKIIWNVINKLELNIKGLKKKFDSWKKELIELGGFLNIMAMIELNLDQRSIVEHFGNKIDLTFLNIEVLSNSINKIILEPILIIKYSISEIVRVLHYRNLKESQLKFLSIRISKIQQKLKLLIDSLVQSLILNNLNKNKPSDINGNNSLLLMESPSLSRALKNFKQTNNAADSSGIDSEEEPVDENPITKSNPQTVNIIKDLHEQLETKQLPCYNSLKDDIEFIDINVEKQAISELEYLIKLLFDVMKNWKLSWTQFTESQVKIWSSVDSN